jgi:hypothetical protein
VDEYIADREREAVAEGSAEPVGEGSKEDEPAFAVGVARELGAAEKVSWGVSDACELELLDALREKLLVGVEEEQSEDEGEEREDGKGLSVARGEPDKETVAGELGVSRKVIRGDLVVPMQRDGEAVTSALREREGEEDADLLVCGEPDVLGDAEPDAVLNELSEGRAVELAGALSREEMDSSADTEDCVLGLVVAPAVLDADGEVVKEGREELPLVADWDSRELSVGARAVPETLGLPDASNVATVVKEAAALVVPVLQAAVEPESFGEVVADCDEEPLGEPESRGDADVFAVSVVSVLRVPQGELEKDSGAERESVEN